MNSITSYETYCQAFQSTSRELKEQALLMFCLRNWFIARTSGTIDNYTSLDEITNFIENKIGYKDCLSRIVDNTFAAFQHISLNMHEKIIRENKLVPIYKVREINSYAINWLSKRNGRNIREKLSGRSTMMAVQRRNSYDTGENRLFLAFALRMLENIDNKYGYLPKLVNDKEKEYKEELMSVLRNEDFSEIRKWENLPPNNTLLSDRNYSSIWRGWTDLQKLDDQIAEDAKNLDKNVLLYILWQLITTSCNIFDFLQQPVLYDFEHFLLLPLYEDVKGIDSKGCEVCIKWLDKNKQLPNCVGILYKNTVYSITINKLVLSLSINGQEHFSCAVKKVLLENIVNKVKHELFGNSQTKNGRDVQAVSASGRHAIVDLFDVRPCYCIDDNPIDILPFRVMRQVFRTAEGNTYDIGVDTAKSLYGHNSSVVETYSLNSVLNNPGDTRTSQLLSLIDRSINVGKLTFLFPDLYNDFQLSKLRKTIRLFYAEVEAIPKSVAAVFKLAKTNYYSKYVHANDVVVVADLVNDQYSLSILTTNFNKKVISRLPETKGLIWERHPATEYLTEDYDSGMSLWERTKQNLENDGCHQTEFIRSNYYTQDTECEQNMLTLYDGGEEWYKFSNVTNKCNAVKYDITNDVKRYIERKRNKNIIKNGNVHILLLSNKLEYNGDYNCLDFNNADCIDGAKYLSDISREVDIPLWSDHLPDLSIKWLLGRFNLVKNKTVVPKENCVVDINIKRTFTLPAKKSGEDPNYHFKLIMNDGSGKTQYEALVQHSAFPLKNDVECRLKMTYSYGADDSYSLTFEPIDKNYAGFSEARVKFVPIKEYKYLNNPIPNFPKADSWEHLEKFPGKFDNNEVNLLKMVENYFLNAFNFSVVDFTKFNCYEKSRGDKGNICIAQGIYDKKRVVITMLRKSCPDLLSANEKFGVMKCTLIPTKRKRYSTGNTSINWRVDKNGNAFCIANVDIDGCIRTVAFFRSNFMFPSDFSTSIDSMSFELNERDGKYTAINILSGVNIPVVYEAQYVRASDGNVSFDESVLGRSSILFAFHSIFNNGRHIDDPKCPLWFRKIIEKYTPRLVQSLSRIKSDDVRYTVSKILTLLTCPLYPQYYNNVKNSIAGYPEKNKLMNEIGCLLGDCTYSEQIELFNRIVSIPIKLKVVCILSKAAWKNSEFIYNVDANKILGLFDYAVRFVTSGKLRKNETLIFLEFILAVFRLRSLDEPMINRHLSLNNSMLMKLYQYLEYLGMKGIDLPTSRLALSVKRGDMWKNHEISDFLYACIVYITGESGESEIKITGVNEGGKEESD